MQTKNTNVIDIGYTPSLTHGEQTQGKYIACEVLVPFEMFTCLHKNSECSYSCGPSSRHIYYWEAIAHLACLFAHPIYNYVIHIVHNTFMVALVQATAGWSRQSFEHKNVLSLDIYDYNSLQRTDFCRDKSVLRCHMYRYEHAKSMLMTDETKFHNDSNSFCRPDQ